MRFLRHLPIRKKIVTVTMLAAVAALLLAGGALFAYELRGYRTKLERDLRTLAQIIGSNCVAALSFGDRAAAIETLSALRAEPQIRAACIYGLDGVPLATFGGGGLTANVPQTPGPDGFLLLGDRLTYFGAIHDERENRRLGTVYFEADFSGIRQRLRSYAGILGLVLAIACLLAFALSAWLQRFISKPIIDLAEATKKVSTQRDYSFRVPQESHDEFGQLIAGFNEMLHQIHARCRRARKEPRVAGSQPGAGIVFLLGLARFAGAAPTCARLRRDAAERHQWPAFGQAAAVSESHQRRECRDGAAHR
jgi:HAMP domain-containing protein